MNLQFGKTFRLKDWWDSKIPSLLAIIYFRMLLAQAEFSFSLFLPVMLFMGWALAAAAFGHYVNDCFDIRSDKVAGKPNQAAGHSVFIRVIISTSLAIAAVFPWIFLPESNQEWIWVLSHLVIFILYSAPPIRLKEKGIFGIFSDSLYALLIPVFLAFHSMDVALSHNQIQNAGGFLSSLFF